VHEASAQHTVERLADVGIARPRVGVQERLGGEDDAVQAEAALRRLGIDERLLKRVRPLDGAEPLERGHLGIGNARQGRDARPHGAAVDDGGAGAALAEAAAKLGAVQLEVIAQHVEKRCGRVHLDRVGAAVYGEANRHVPTFAPAGPVRQPSNPPSRAAGLPTSVH
jgi:hypothetical protein